MSDVLIPLVAIAVLVLVLVLWSRRRRPGCPRCD